MVQPTDVGCSRATLRQLLGGMDENDGLECSRATLRELMGGMVENGQEFKQGNEMWQVWYWLLWWMVFNLATYWALMAMTTLIGFRVVGGAAQGGGTWVASCSPDDELITSTEVGFESSTDDRRLEDQHTDDGPAGNAIRIQSDDFSEQEDGTQDQKSGSS